MNQEQAKEHLIRAYRKVIEERYQYDAITAEYDIPDSFNEERVATFRDFFLEYIYPDIEKRTTLDEAFNHLDSYIQQPQKLLQILLESGRLIFKHGRHLPKILSAGLKALRSFRAATHFEEKLIEAAAQSDIPPPYSRSDINTLIRTLSLEDIDDFIAGNEALFSTLYDQKLVKKIQEIVHHLIQRMKSKPQLFSTAEIQALEIGSEIIHKGNHLFDSLSKDEQRLIFEFVVQMEKENLEQIFENNA